MVSAKEFWRFVSKTLVKHHTKFAESMRLAAMGYHFRKLSDAYGGADPKEHRYSEARISYSAVSSFSSCSSPF